MSNLFDVYYSNITSNQAPGLSEYEKSVFLTKAEKEIVKNYFSPNSKGNTLGQGFDDSAKRQADFSILMRTNKCDRVFPSNSNNEFPERIDDRSLVFKFPADTFIVINEAVKVVDGLASDERPVIKRRLQVRPLKYDEYTRLMSKPFKRPLKNQAWRLINSGTVLSDSDTITNAAAVDFKGTATKKVELILNSWDMPNNNPQQDLIYSVRYVRVPKPIILVNLAPDSLTIDGYSAQSTECEIDPILHEDILQRAVELAKIAWTATGQDNAQLMMTAGQRSE